MPLKFPEQGTVAWHNYFMQHAIQNRVDVQRLWQGIPQIPDVQAGIPFWGPTSPDFFSTPPSISSRSSSGSSSSGSSSGSASSRSSSLTPCETGGLCKWTWTFIGEGDIRWTPATLDPGEVVCESPCECEFPWWRDGEFIEEIIYTQCFQP